MKVLIILLEDNKSITASNEVDIDLIMSSMKKE